MLYTLANGHDLGVANTSPRNNSLGCATTVELRKSFVFES